jgi:hypothetical protein
LLAGAFGGIVGAVLLAFGGALVGSLAGPVGSVFAGTGVLLVGIVVALLFAIPSGIAGALGGWLKGSRQKRGVKPPEPAAR